MQVKVDMCNVVRLALLHRICEGEFIAGYYDRPMRLDSSGKKWSRDVVIKFRRSVSPKREPPGYPNPSGESQQGMAPQSSTSALLPIELWRQIFEYLRLPPLGLEQAAPSDDYYARCRALQGLCRTSRWFLAIARPYLYENIVLCTDARAVKRWDSHDDLPGQPYVAGARSVLLLVKTLTDNHTLRPLIKNLAIPIRLSKFRPDSLECSTSRDKTSALLMPDLHDIMHNAQPEDLALLEAAGLSLPLKAGESKSLKIIDGEEKTAKDEFILSSMAPRLIAALLCMTHNVDTLLLRGLLVGQVPAFDESVQSLANWSRDEPGAAPFLPRLKTLRMQGDTLWASAPRNGPNSMHTTLAVKSPLLNIPSLTSLKATCAWSGNPDIADSVSAGLASLQSLDLLVFSGLCRVQKLLDATTTAKSLSITLVTPAQERQHEMPPTDLNSILLARADSLESFSLDTRRATHAHANDSLGPLEKLICLPHLRKLTHLTIEPHLLIDWFEVNTWPQFLSYMPPDLASVTFRFMPEHGHDQLRIWARSGLGAVLRSSREKWQSRVPRLRRIHLLPLPFSPRAVEAVRDDLAACGIGLSWTLFEDVDEVEDGDKLSGLMRGLAI